MKKITIIIQLTQFFLFFFLLFYIEISQKKREYLFTMYVWFSSKMIYNKYLQNFIFIFIILANVYDEVIQFLGNLIFKELTEKKKRYRDALIV